MVLPHERPMKCLQTSVGSFVLTWVQFSINRELLLKINELQRNALIEQNDHLTIGALLFIINGLNCLLIRAI